MNDAETFRNAIAQLGGAARIGQAANLLIVLAIGAENGVPVSADMLRAIADGLRSDAPKRRARRKT